jgi:hypothetical protein
MAREDDLHGAKKSTDGKRQHHMGNHRQMGFWLAVIMTANENLCRGQDNPSRPTVF